MYKLGIVLCLGAGVACTESTSSQNLRTGGMAALIDVTATDTDVSEVDIQLRVGGDESNTFVDLEGGDRLFAEADGERKEMLSEGRHYEAEFDLGTEDVAFKVSLQREDDDDAPNSNGTLPAPFSITSNFGATPISRATDNLVISWSPSGSTDAMDVEIRAPECIFTMNQDIGGDPGTYTLNAGSLDALGADTETCNVTIRLRRTREGDADRAFDSESYFRAHQIRTTTFVSGP